MQREQGILRRAKLGEEAPAVVGAGGDHGVIFSDVESAVPSIVGRLKPAAQTRGEREANERRAQRINLRSGGGDRNLCAIAQTVTVRRILKGTHRHTKAYTVR